MCTASWRIRMQAHSHSGRTPKELAISGCALSLISKLARDVLVAIASGMPWRVRCSITRCAPGSTLTLGHLHSQARHGSVRSRRQTHLTAEEGGLVVAMH